MQHGFIKGRSSCTQLIQFTDDIGKILDNSGQVDVLYLDFCKAFDKVHHSLLLKKLSWYGIGGNMMQWFSSYLSNRYQRVVVKGSHSGWLPVTSGVPQGSILGPLLFILYINDIPSCLKYSKITCFADDTKLYTSVNNIDDCHKLQVDLCALLKWSDTWKMQLNYSKCKILSITHKRTVIMYDYYMGNQLLERCENMKDLGIIIDRKLNWNVHVSKTVSKANKVMGLVKRTVGYNAHTSVTRQLYISLVRSLLEYCTPVWNGLAMHDVILIERVQRSATRYILKFPDIDYRERLIKLHMLPLSFRRDYLDVCLFFKYCHNIMYNCNVFMWNSLPPEMRNIGTVSTFKKHARNHFFDLLKNNFNCNDICTWFLKCRCCKCRLI
jgi:hypothetical protein